MAKTVHNDVLDAALNHIATNCDSMVCCSSTPTSYAQAVSTTHKLAQTNMSGADFTGPADGDTSGRKIGVGSKADVPVSATNSAEVFALLETSGAGTLLYTTDVSGIQQVTDGNTMTFGTWAVEILDPTP